MLCKHSCFWTAFVFVLTLSVLLPFGSYAHGQDKKTEKNYQRAEKFFKKENYKKAVRFYTKAAEQGHTKAQLLLGGLYFDGKGITRNCDQGDFWYRQALKQSYAPAQYALARRFEQEGKGGKGGKEKCVTQSHARAGEWYLKAAEQGHLGAQSRLGILYLEGKGFAKSYTRAAEWLRKAAEQGQADAQNRLAWLYETGKRSFSEDGLEQDYKKAVEWYRKAADQGNVNAQINLGWLYYREENYPPRGIEQDYTQAAQLFGKAAKQGNALAQSYLGFLYQEGIGIEQDDAQAAEWYRKAAEQGYFHGQVRLAGLYQSGKGVEQDYSQAVEWYRKVTDSMNHSRVRNLGEGYAGYPIGGYGDVIGVEKNISIAYTLFLISEKKVKYFERDREQSRSRAEKVKKELTMKQIADAEKVAEAWSKEQEK